MIFKFCLQIMKSETMEINIFSGFYNVTHISARITRQILHNFQKIEKSVMTSQNDVIVKCRQKDGSVGKRISL